jgi:hypothetical protein
MERLVKIKTNKFKEIAQVLSSHRQRQTGKTTAICYGAMAIDAIVICNNNFQSGIISNKFNVSTVRIGNLNNLMGNDKPLLLEHSVTEDLLNEAGDRIIELEKEIEILKGRKVPEIKYSAEGMRLCFPTF